ncbi:alpha-(1,6)-fucosyltransferase [Ixodes scapularis]|uniref:alpha-(1,6)-fucosyltransferase n=1 Tax=Ixodes scapularis TaxID=6945 RepID=UPI001A9D8F86|nr:alpha-(1,6)-fucosyltransferase [Ixodes scapularis]
MSFSKKGAYGPSNRVSEGFLAATMKRSQCRKFGMAVVLVAFLGLVYFLITRGSSEISYSPVDVRDWPLLSYGLMRTPAESQARHQDDSPRSRVDKNVFDSTMLTRTEDRHAAMLRKLQATIVGLRNFQVHRLRALFKAGGDGPAILSKSREFLRSMELDVKNIRELGGVNRSVASNMLKLRNYVREKIHALQNPTDCGRTPKLRCLLDNPHGVAAGIHDVLWCFVAALRMGRTVVLDSSQWHYAPGKEWAKTFLPIAGPSCSNAPKNNTIEKGYPGYDSAPKERSQILDLPSTIVEPLVGNHGSPYAWWYGQIVSYAFRLQDSTLRKIEELKAAQGYAHPIVGVHIRQTDKSREAAYHSVEEYMSHVEEFYAGLSLTAPVEKKRVFVATDEPKVVDQIRKKFPDYLVIHNNLSSSQAHDLGVRSKSSSLFGVISDIHLLAESDFLVCTMSSGFCRVAYELMQARHPDASLMAASLDVEYFYAYVPFPPRRTLQPNVPSFASELGWSGPGVLIERPGTFASLDEAKFKKNADGFVAGRIAKHAAVKQMTVFPVFKTVQTYRVANYSAFGTLPPS